MIAGRWALRYGLLGLALLLGLAAPAGAALSPASITSWASDTNTATYTSASNTVNANRLLLLSFYCLKETAGTITVNSITGHSATWELVTSVGSGDPEARWFLYRSMLGSGSTDTIAVAFAANCNRFGAHLDEIDGVDTGGTNGSAAIVNSATNAGTDPITVTLSAFADSANRPYGGFVEAGSGTQTFAAESGWTVVADAGSIDGTIISIATVWRDASDDLTVVGDYGTGSVFMRGIAVELKPAAASSGSRGLLLGVW